jgi:hypothetical protein
MSKRLAAGEGEVAEAIRREDSIWKKASRRFLPRRPYWEE